MLAIKLSNPSYKWLLWQSRGARAFKARSAHHRSADAGMPAHLPQSIPGRGEPSKAREEPCTPPGRCERKRGRARKRHHLRIAGVTRLTRNTRSCLSVRVTSAHAHQNERRRQARGVPRRPQDKARHDMCDAVFGIGWQAGCLLRNDPFYASVVEVLDISRLDLGACPLINVASQRNNTSHQCNVCGI